MDKPAHWACHHTVGGLPKLEYYRKYNAARKEKSREWRKAHPRTKESRKIEYQRAKDRMLLLKRQEYAKNPGKARAYSAMRRAKRTPEQIDRDREYQRRYRTVHGQRLNKKKVARINSLVELRVLRALRGSINSSIARAKRRLQFVKKCANTKRLIGCDVDTLIAHIEKQFLPGMTWANHGFRGWHIDHILPCASFDMTYPEQQRKCFHYTNLQPLWWLDNIKKGDKILTPQENEQLRM